MTQVFLVEDSPIIRESLTETLVEVVGATVVGYADTDTAALNWLCAHPERWDVAIVDLFLKSGNGINVLGGIKDRAPDKRAIVLSNYASPPMREQCLANGADAVFDKSTELDELTDYLLGLG